MVVLLVSSNLLAQAQNTTNAFPPTTNVNFTSATQFKIPSYNSTVVFSSGGSYANASLDSGSWNFNGLFVNDGTSALPNFMGVGFSVSARNCKVTITHLDALNVVPPFPGELDYTVVGVGSQIFNLHYSNNELLNWTVYIDGVAKPQNNGWTVSADGTLTIACAVSAVCIQWAEASPTTFSPSDSFAIPACNSTVSFSYCGTYLGTAGLTDNVLYFQNLALNGITPSGIPFWDFAVSAQNCNITITGYNPGTLTGLTDVATWLNYTVAGIGTQNVNLNYGYTNGNIAPNGPLNYTVYVDGENRTAGDGWSLLNNGWVTITGATSNVSVYYLPNTALNDLPPPAVGLANSGHIPEPTTSASSSTIPPDTGSALRPSNLLFFVGLAGIIIIAVVAPTLIELRRIKKAAAPKNLLHEIEISCQLSGQIVGKFHAAKGRE